MTGEGQPEPTRLLRIPIGSHTASIGGGYSASQSVRVVDVIEVEFPERRLTAEQWSIFLSVLDAMRPALAEMPPQPPEPPADDLALKGDPLRNDSGEVQS